MDETYSVKYIWKALTVLVVVMGCAAPLSAGEGSAEYVTKDEIRAIMARIAELESKNRLQAARIAELEERVRSSARDAGEGAPDSSRGAPVNDTERVFTAASGRKYLLADEFERIFEPLTESGLRLVPYGHLAFDCIWNSHAVKSDVVTDFVKRSGKGGSALSMQDTILGVKFNTPLEDHGWTFSGKAEFDFVGADQNDYVFHWRHLYIDAAHESGWSVLFGQTWHLWKMVSPCEIDGAWMENAGHPYRRSPQLRIAKKWDWRDSSLVARVGAVKGGPGMGGDRDKDLVQDNSASNWALLQGALVYDRVAPWEEDGRRWLVGLAGMYGRDRSHRLLGFDPAGNGVYGGKDDEYDSTMVMAGASLPFCTSFTLTGQFFAGENLGGISGGCSQCVAYARPGKGREVSTIGGFADIEWKVNEKLSFAVGYGFDDPTDSSARHALGILRNDRAYIDAFYDIRENFRLGLEYARLTTRYGDAGEDSKDDVSDDRVQFTIWYNF